jgi:prepilin-type N-terminal cleavage/methylation domain-containing protein
MAQTIVGATVPGRPLCRDKLHRCSILDAEGGFTLIELITAIAIVALIISLIIPPLAEYRQKVLESERAATEDTISKAIRQCYALEGRYPPVLGDTGLDYLAGNYGIILKPQDFVYNYVIVDGAPQVKVDIKKKE